MKENKLVELSMDFSVDIINLVKFLKSNHESAIANQIGRSGTSIGANYWHAFCGYGYCIFHSRFPKGDFTHANGLFRFNYCRVGRGKEKY